jgi:NhaC family Na+:H+ antiporter
MTGAQVNEQNKIWLSLLSLIVSLLIVLWGGIVLRIGFLIPLLAAATFASLVGLWMGFSWSEIQKGILRTIDKAMIAGIILLLVGILVGVWIVSGTIPYLIYWGLKILTPGTFLLGAFIFYQYLFNSNRNFFRDNRNCRSCVIGSR